MGSRLNYLDTHSSGQRRQIHRRVHKHSDAHTHTYTHTHTLFCLEFFPVCLAAPLSAFLCLSAMLCFSRTIFFFLIPSYFFPFFFLLSLPILAFSSLFSFTRHNNSFLSVRRGSLFFLGGLDLSRNSSFHTLSLSLPSHQLSSLSPSHTFLSLTVPSFQLSVQMSLHLLFFFFYPRLSASLLALHLPPSSPSFSLRHWVTSTILYGAPWDVSVISRSLISKSSSWHRTRHAEEHRHKARRQLMRPHTPTAAITRPLQRRVSRLLSLVQWTVGNPQLNNCSSV